MITFAPVTNPTVAGALPEPFQASSDFGATLAGPLVKCLVEAALAIQSGFPRVQLLRHARVERAFLSDRADLASAVTAA